MTPERIAELREMSRCPLCGELPRDGRFCSARHSVADQAWHEMVDEIERLQSSLTPWDFSMLELERALEIDCPKCKRMVHGLADEVLRLQDALRRATDTEQETNA